MSITTTPQQTIFPSKAVASELDPNRYIGIPTPALMKKRTLFGIPLRSFLTNEVVDDDTLQYYIDVAISEIEHALDLYITPTKFNERHDYSRHLQFWSFGYMKVDHSPVQNVEKFNLTFSNGVANGQVLVSIPLEFIHTQPQEGTVQLVPAAGVSISGLITSLYSGMGYHAFNSQAISHWPGAIDITYTAGFEKDRIPALLAGLIENLAALNFLSSMGPVLFPHNSVSIGIDGTSQSVGTLGPGFLQNRLSDLEKMIEKQMDIARGHYQKKFLIDVL